ncbi:hypothetical protein COCON_G00143730 [Conger conger]|uniref:Tyrosine-protein kinase n=2 Tax=Conger conger TaxID=82655 RepID=A0A9Q1DC58_CONCO|nr:protein-tyrosine kinase 6b isoform X1 [Conger conger]KAJ8265274.1 hypothetical protein COCON_G00143730 [Conger conger]
MGETSKNTCPCLRTLCERLFGSSKHDGVQNRDDNDSSAVRGSSKRNEGIEVPSNVRYALHPPKPAESAIYTAMWAFEARADRELSFQEGDLFNITDRSGDWWTARKVDRNGRILATGIVPYNYLARRESTDAMPWYFGEMNRIEASGHLMAPENGEGAFLVRLSEKDDVGYVLSVKVDNKVKHFKIHQNEELFNVNESATFASLMDLVDHFMTSPLSISVERLNSACRRNEPKPQDLSHSTVDEWELPKEEFTFGDQLGSGYFADVYRGKWKDQINVAIKVLKNNEALNHREFQLETQILKRLRHKHLITLFAICSSSPPYYIITELMEKGNLLDFLRGPEGGAMDMVFLIDMGAQVADGMAYLESQNSIHRDLAARNVLVGENYICKVADFGLARVIKEPFYTSEDKKIPYKWCAPEAISHGRFSSKSDVWSFGVLLYEIVTYGGTPYPACSNSDVYQLITSGYRMPAPPQCPEYIYEAMLSCWQCTPEDRTSFLDLKYILESSYELE